MPKKIAPALWLVLQELKNNLARLLSSEQRRLLLAVSGGADSLALAHACAQLAQELQLTLKVCHVEHGLRGSEALTDAELVERFCNQLQLDFVRCSVDVKTFCQLQGCSVEEGARLLRYEALKAEARKLGGAIVVTAHHRDDQVETFLLKLLRGAGPEGLRGMQPLSRRGELLLCRPLLNLGRRELEEYCRTAGIVYCQDSTNQDCHYTRNRIRLQLLPQLEQEYNQRIRNNLVNTMELLSEQEDFLKAEEDRCWQELQDINKEVPEAGLCLRAEELRALKPFMGKRLLRRAYFELGGKELSQERTEALEKLLLAGVGGKSIQLPGRITVYYLKGKLIFQKETKENHYEHE